MLPSFVRTSEQKVMRDPVHGYIHVDYRVIWDLINAAEFQRLRRIHQLGGTFQVYHTAEHSRFSHSLGVYEITRIMIEQVDGLKDVLSEFEIVALLCAGLLHDIGHGPYSHAFEAVTAVHHEAFTSRIILEDSEVHRVMAEVHPDLPQFVNDIIAHECERPLLTQIISSQLDADRMDYLLRDSYFTGVSYGEFDLGRIIRTMKVVDDLIVVKESGIHAVEDYIMARYQMYWQVYLHPTSRSFEVILLSLFQRMRECFEMGSYALEQVAFFKPFLSEGEISLRAHYELDESACNYGFMKLTKSQDPILADLSR
ncbi:MAG: HD domain-containing protein, partial [Erysipelothrix sp.]|nr:HD domain-containing protein [Erysipelothrix sp.]